MRRLSQGFVVGLLFAIAALDMFTGLRLLISSEPWLQNGFEPSWNALSGALRNDADLRKFLYGSYRRLGAFSFHMGVVTMIWAFLGRRNRSLLTVLLVAYSLNGAIFFYVDFSYTRGTEYFLMKQVIGTLWAVALALHFLGSPKAQTPPSQERP